MNSRELFSHWAIVTTGASCGAHPDTCPAAVWGPYTLHEAEYVVTTISPDFNPHVVPFWVREVRFGASHGGDAADCRSSGQDPNVVRLVRNPGRRYR